MKRTDRPHRESREELHHYTQVPNHYAVRSRNRDRGRAPDLPKGQREPARHLGKGSLSYRRADDRIRNEVCERLMIDPEVDASDIAIDVKEGTVWLSGTVDTRNTRFYVEDLVDRVLGVTQVVNRLKIRLGRALEEFTRSDDAARLREQLARETQFR